MALSSSDNVDSIHPSFNLQSLPGKNDVVAQGAISLEDAAEELSLHMAHRVEHQVHSELKVSRDHSFIEIKIEAIILYLEKMWEQGAQAALEVLVSQILEGRTGPQAAVSNFSKDKTQQFLALNYVLQRAQQENVSPDLIKSIFDAYADLEKSAGPAIRANLNTIDAALGYSPDVSDIKKFQHTYYDIVINESSLPKTFSKALSLFGGKKIAAGLQHLITALGLDLSATRSSVSMEKISTVITDLYQLQTITTTLESCENIRGKLSESARSSFNPEKLMQGIIDLVDIRFVSPTMILNLSNGQGVESVEDRITFFTATKLIIKEIPSKIFHDEEDLQSAIESAQFSLDSAIQEEE